MIARTRRTFRQRSGFAGIRRRGSFVARVVPGDVGTCRGQARATFPSKRFVESNVLPEVNRQFGDRGDRPATVDCCREARVHAIMVCTAGVHRNM